MGARTPITVRGMPVQGAAAPGTRQRCALSAALGTALFMAAGCVTDRALVDDQLHKGRDPAQALNVTERYCVGCPDVLEIAVKDRPEFAGNYVVEPDGRINLGRYGRLRVDGRNLAEVGRLLGEEIGSAPGDVRARIVDFRSQHVILFGAVIGWQRSVPYQGQETVLELLQRVGGITPGAAPEHVYVVRAHLVEGRRPEVFHVDLDAIVMDQDERTNIRILPYDHVYVGETRKARIEKCIPPWLRPAYQKLWNLLPVDDRPREKENALSRWVAGGKNTP